MVRPHGSSGIIYCTFVSKGSLMVQSSLLSLVGSLLEDTIKLSRFPFKLSIWLYTNGVGDGERIEDVCTTPVWNNNIRRFYKYHCSSTTANIHNNQPHCTSFAMFGTCRYTYCTFIVHCNLLSPPYEALLFLNSLSTTSTWYCILEYSSLKKAFSECKNITKAL